MNTVIRVPLRIAYTGILALASAGAARAAQVQLHFYMLGSSAFNSDTASRVASAFNLTEAHAPTGAPTGVFQMGDGSVRAAFTINWGDIQGNNAFYMVPDLRNPDLRAPTASNAQTMALNFCKQFGLFTPERFGAGKPDTWTHQGDSQKNGQTAPVNALMTVRFGRTADGLPVVGPTSLLTLDVSSAGVVGFLDSLRPLQLSNTPVMLKTSDQIANELAQDVRLLQNGRKYQVLSKHPAYYEQGMMWAQPVYIYNVRFTGQNGFASDETITIPLATNSPEDITMYPFRGMPPIFAPTPSSSALNLDGTPYDNLLASAAPVVQANPVQIGEYVVREDDDCWLSDAKAFWSTSNFGQAITSFFTGHSPLHRLDYWWDEPWMWEPALGFTDHSPSFVGEDHFVLIEGHGAPWEITCYKNYGDVIHLKQIKGYGASQVAGERTAYIVWQSCDVIPEPGHAYDGDFQSPATAWDVWWPIFKGMRGNFGYRTIMHICNGVGGAYGLTEGLGFHNVASWLDATENNVLGHYDGDDYGSCVIVSGHEGDTLYTNTQLAPPGSLTMWWIHA